MGCVLFVFEVVYIHLPPSMADLVPCDHSMKKAYYSSCPKEKNGTAPAAILKLDKPEAKLLHSTIVVSNNL